jgi:ferredoxin
MQYIAYAQRGDFAKCADLSFDCVMCGCCSSRCPAGISHPQVAELARRLNGKYLQPQAQHLLDRVKEIDAGKCEKEIKKLIAMSTGDKKQIKNLYNNREIEK